VKTKIGTVLNHDLVRGPRSIAAREGKRFNQVLEEALCDHFIPWAREPDNGIENPVAADPRCNNDKRDFVASTGPLQRWTDTHFDAGKRPVDALEEISSTLGWESHPDQTLAVARSIYLRLPEGTKLWDHGKEFTGLKQEAVRATLGAAV
jgi:hypothetical protein